MEWPRTAQSVARDMPVDPDVPSTTIPPVRVWESAFWMVRCREVEEGEDFGMDWSVLAVVDGGDGGGDGGGSAEGWFGCWVAADEDDGETRGGRSPFSSASFSMNKAARSFPVPPGLQLSIFT